ncbi:DUF1553 domain-containing protein [Roseibacillus persicicus]|uniref:DUF1553 domain-containing protein n=1 Tax=Roseibacillus persicicus TaxID=454148 RepID=UPI00398AEC90
MRFSLLGILALLPASAEVSYNYDVRPILSDKCFFCHGPDEKENGAGLRLDNAASAFAALKESDGFAIVPGKVEESVAWHRIISSEPDEVMPPPKSNLVLTDDEKEILRLWIEQGAPYEKHWAFANLPPEVEVPQPANQEWPNNAIDQFILSRLEKEDIAPSEPASPLRWLRRATFDLTGLPPSPEEIERFATAARDNLQTAKQEAVERLLQSQSYGEHLAVGWLDAARYADSYGYQSDKLNTQWPYRDWVVEAFNSNLPYNDFLTWNIAGDLLPNATREQKLATAFNRLHRLNNEGGAIFEEWRTENIADRVHTFGTAVLGLTMECTRCHDHKYDPLTMTDYYSLFAFFNSIDENGMYDRTKRVPSPTLLLPNEKQESQLHQAESRLAEARSNYQNELKASQEAFQNWLTTLEGRGVGLEMPKIGLDFSTGELNPKFAKFAEGDHGNAPPLEFKPLHPNQPEPLALALDGDRYLSFHDIPSFDRWTPFSISITLLQSQSTQHRAVLAHHSRGTDAGFNGWDLTLEKGFLESRLYRVWPGNGMGVRTLEPIPTGELQNIVATWDASDQASGLKLYLNGIELATEILRDKKVKSASVTTQHGGKFALGSRWRDAGLAGALIADFGYFDRTLSQAEVAKIADYSGEVSLKDYFTLRVHEPTRKAKEALHQAVKALVDAEEPVNEIPVMEELAHPLPAYILDRGAYDAPKTPDKIVPRNTPAMLMPFPEDAPRDRLGLAQWTTHPDNPLTARVFVNRMWAAFFGTGLIDTPENLGLQGALPSHPELLDWLARNFVESGWDIKALCRQIVLSSTYGQNSRHRPELAEIDPENRLLARGPAHRLSAEQIRDLSLAASGLLNPAAGGPPVSPYQPGEDLWTESNGMSPPYRQSVGQALYRRSLYSVWKRTAPLPNMLAFDAGSREVCSVARSRTNTPLQALVLLNDVQFVEAARHLAEEIAHDEPTREIEAAFLRLVGRQPTAEEQEVLLSLYQEQLDRFQKDPEAALKLVSLGESDVESDHPTAKLAASTVICQTILNLDATIWKR